MSNLMIAKVKYKSVDSSTGKDKIVTEQYILNAISFTEAEKRIYYLFEEERSIESAVVNISPTNISEIVQENSKSDSNTDNSFFKCKVVFTNECADTGKEKKINTFILVKGKDIKDIYSILENYLSDRMCDVYVNSVVLTKIVEFIDCNNNTAAE